MTDDLEIPTFLRRGHPDCVVGNPQVQEICKQILADRSIGEPDIAAHEDMHRQAQGLAPLSEVDRNHKTDKVVADLMGQKRKLTAAFKSRVAAAIIAQVKAGADTFGKLRKALPDYDDRELKSGIRYAEKWMPMLERRGTKRKPVMHRYQARVERQGKRYSVVTY